MPNSSYFLLEYNVEIVNDCDSKKNETRNIEQFQHFIKNKIYYEESMLHRTIPAIIFKHLKQKGYHGYKIKFWNIDVICCTFVEQDGVEILEYGETMIPVEKMQTFISKYEQMFNCNKFPSYLNMS